MEDAVICFRKMIEKNIIPCVPYVHVLLNAMVRNNMFSEARVTFNDIVRMQIPYDCATIRVMIRGSCHEGKVEEAAEYFWDAKANGIELDAITYSTAIHAICKKPDAMSACALLNEMKEKGWIPSEGTYTNVIVAV